MGIKIRSADLVEDRELLISTLSQHLTPLSNEKRFEWLYLQNPEGEARVWLAVDDVTGRVVGASAAFPRTLIVEGNNLPGWVLGDFCISGDYRSLGPALQLQRATLGGIDAGQAQLCYDFPSQPMTAIYKRLGVKPEAELVRFSRRLRIYGKGRRALGKIFSLEALVLLFNTGLRVVSTFRQTGKWDFEIHQGKCDEEFTTIGLASDLSHSGYRRKSAEYLNWRYLQHPNLPHQVLSARVSGRLAGYLVFSLDAGIAEVVEMCAGSDLLFAALLNELSRRLGRSDVASISVFLCRGDSREHIVRKSGFWRRESSPVMVYWPKRAAENRREVAWCLMQGDRD